MIDIIQEDDHPKIVIVSALGKWNETDIKMIDLLIDYYECYVNKHEIEKF
jgi:hypothetical protein